MTTPTRTQRASTAAYYLGRPAVFWLNALAARRDGKEPARSSPC